MARSNSSKLMLAGFLDTASETPSGNQPVRDWIKGLSPEDRQLVGRDVQKVEFGWPIGMSYCRSLGNGLWEVGIDLTDGKIGRVMFCVVRGRMVLFQGFIKKTQKTPAKDMELAVKRRKWNKKWLRRRKGK